MGYVQVEKGQLLMFIFVRDCPYIAVTRCLYSYARKASLGSPALPPHELRIVYWRKPLMATSWVQKSMGEKRIESKAKEKKGKEHEDLVRSCVSGVVNKFGGGC